MVSTIRHAQNRADTPANNQHVVRTSYLSTHLLMILRGPPHRQHRLPWPVVGQADQLACLGFYKSVGMNHALSHWRLELPGGQEIHLQEQADHYEVHWDHVSLRRDPVGHALLDAPGLSWGFLFLAFAMFGRGGR